MGKTMDGIKAGPVLTIKRAVSLVYGNANVSVCRGRGSAYGWIYAKVKVPSVEAMANVRDNVEKIAVKALKEVGLEFQKYYSEDGFGGEHNCFSIVVNHK